MGSDDSTQFYGRFESTSLGLYFEDCLMLNANFIQDDNTYCTLWYGRRKIEEIIRHYKKSLALVKDWIN